GGAPFAARPRRSRFARADVAEGLQLGEGLVRVGVVPRGRRGRRVRLIPAAIVDAAAGGLERRERRPGYVLALRQSGGGEERGADLPYGAAAGVATGGMDAGAAHEIDALRAVPLRGRGG